MALQDVCTKFGLVGEYKHHLRCVSLDRDLEQHFQSLCPWESDKPTIFCQIDGMDQSKWSIPRYPQNQESKHVSKFIRPRVKIIGCWMSGYLLSLYIVDTNFAHDASLTIEASQVEMVHPQQKNLKSLILNNAYFP